MVSDFAFLNVHAPPFDDVRVRRALNLAVDRAAVAADYGGRAAATPTCQILPPQIPGYRPYCPYTRGASIRGRWQSPDLARARRLVAASGTRGMKVTVWEAPPPHVLAEEGQVIATALRRLGFRASMRTMDYSAFVPFTDDSRNRAQVIQGGWSADYPTADDFIGKLTCGYFVPGNGPATTDASEFCDPAIDRQAAAAASLQTAAPGEADAMWADLDRRLTNRAIWLPTVNLNEIDFLSRRVGNYKYNPVWGALLDQLWVR
jgi:peptide/nickel transport system substrate-binding protein